MYAPALKLDETSESNVRFLSDLHQSFLGQLKTPFAPTGGSTGRSSVRSNDILSQVETLVSLVENSQSVIDELVARIRDHEAIVYDLRSRLSEESAQKEAAYQQAARGEVAIRVEKERAEVAEARAKSAEEEVKRLESRETIIGERLARLTTVVGNLNSAMQIKSPAMTSVA